jgi:hypothetical protein
MQVPSREFQIKTAHNSPLQGIDTSFMQGDNGAEPMTGRSIHVQ